MRLNTFFVISVMIALTSCVMATPSASKEQVYLTATRVLTPTSSFTPVPTTTLPSNGTIVFWDKFDSKSLNEKWTLLEGKPDLGKILLPTDNKKVSLQFDYSAYPSDFTIQFDINQCGNNGYIQLTLGNQLQLEFLSDLSTNQLVQLNNKWQELPTGRIHRCAAHIVVLVKSSTYIVLNVHNDDTTKILEGKIGESFYGLLILTVTPYAFIDNFMFTIP